MSYRVIAIDTGDDKRLLMEKYGVHAWIDFRVEQVSCLNPSSKLKASHSTYDRA